MSEQQGPMTPMHRIDEQMIALLGELRHQLQPYIDEYEDRGWPAKGSADRDLQLGYTCSEWLRWRAIDAACDAIQNLIIRAPGWEQNAMLATTYQRNYIQEHQFFSQSQSEKMIERRSKRHE